MFSESQLKLLCDTFSKCHVRTNIVALNDSVKKIFDDDFTTSLTHIYNEDVSIHRFLGNPQERTLYKMTDVFGRCYIYFLLPNKTILFLGPYLSESISPREILEVGEKNSISPKSQQYLTEYYSSLFVISETSHLFTLLDTFLENLWDSPSFAIIDVNRESQIPVSPINETAKNDNFDDVLVNMKTMETRYKFENELMQAVTLGQIHKEKQLLSMFSEYAFEKRTTDILRNAKNYAIIMNTLLRKAAENGGVHPMYLDRVSSQFAVKIEQISALSEISSLMHEIFLSYCRLVRKHSTKSYSPLVQKTVLLVDSDLSANLTLASLSKTQNVSTGYLSTIFKKETGKTISEYIRERRIKHASHLLATTHLQVQTVALHCGIVDVQYFSKIFKKQTGKTPKEYRDSMK
jgi:AraC-like DNA-binding protein